MAKLFLESGAAEIQLENSMKCYGATGGESLTLGTSVRSVLVDQNVEQLNLSGLASDYMFQQAGNQLHIFSGADLVVTIPLQDDSNGTLIRFGDGVIVSALLSSQGAMSLGGKTVGTTSSSVNPINSGAPAGAITGSGVLSSTHGKLFFDEGDPTIIVSNPLSIFGSVGTTDTVQISSGTTGVVCDQNIERASLPVASSVYKYQQSGNQLRVFEGATLVATIPVQDDIDGTQMTFSDGTFSAKLGSAGAMMLGGASVSANSPTSITGIGTPTSLLTQAQAKSSANTTLGTLLQASDAAMVGMLMGSAVKWSSTNLTYSFPTSMPSDYSGKADYSTNWSALNSAEQIAARAVFTKLAELIPVGLTEVTGNNGDLRFSVVDQSGSAGFAVTPAENRPFDSGLEGDVFLATSNRTSTSSNSFLPKDSGFATVLHEIGHAMGLKHPFESPLVPQGTDSHDYTVMSYTEALNRKAIFTKSGNSANVSIEPTAMPASYQLYDIAALQVLYGANSETRSGNSTYTVSSRSYDYICIWDGGGSDTIDAASATGQCIVNLDPGTFSTIDLWPLEEQKAETIAQLGQGFSSWISSTYDNHASQLYTGNNNLAIAYGVVIENVTTGSGNDSITDNRYNNSIQCGTGNDTVYLGAGGFDTVDGGTGVDAVIISSVTKSQLQMEKQSDNSLLLLGPSFAAKLIGIESVTCSDGALTLPA